MLCGFVFIEDYWTADWK